MSVNAKYSGALKLEFNFITTKKHLWSHGETLYKRYDKQLPYRRDNSLIPLLARVVLGTAGRLTIARAIGRIFFLDEVGKLNLQTFQSKKKKEKEYCRY